MYIVSREYFTLLVVDILLLFGVFQCSDPLNIAIFAPTYFLSQCAIHLQHASTPSYTNVFVATIISGSTAEIIHIACICMFLKVCDWDILM